MQVADKAEPSSNTRGENREKYLSLMNSNSRKQRARNGFISRSETFNGKSIKKTLKKHSFSTPRLPVVKTNTHIAKKNTRKSTNLTSNIASKHKASADIWKSKTTIQSTLKNRNRLPIKNRVTYPLMSTIDRRMLDSISSYGHPVNSKKKYLFSDTSLEIKPIELKPRKDRIKDIKYTAKTELKKEDYTRDPLDGPLFPNLSSGFQVEPLYLYSPPSFSPSEEVNSLAFLLDGISLSPPPPSELSFSSSSSPLFFSPSNDLLD